MGKRPRMEESAEQCTVPTSPKSDQPVAVAERPHQVEQEVRRYLLTHPNLRFSSLVIRRIRDGVCLEGVLDADQRSPDVCTVAQSVAGVHEVLNHLVVQSSGGLPAKG